MTAAAGVVDLAFQELDAVASGPCLLTGRRTHYDRLKFALMSGSASPVRVT